LKPRQKDLTPVLQRSVEAAGVKRTYLGLAFMTAYDPYETSPAGQLTIGGDHAQPVSYYGMAEMLSAGSNKTFTCQYCGAKYEFINTRLPVKEHDSAICVACGNTMYEKHSIESRSFTLVERPNR
jgi:hypothetical protein